MHLKVKNISQPIGTYNSTNASLFVCLLLCQACTTYRLKISHTRCQAFRKVYRKKFYSLGIVNTFLVLRVHSYLQNYYNIIILYYILYYNLYVPTSIYKGLNLMVQYLQTIYSNFLTTIETMMSQWYRVWPRHRTIWIRITE